MRLRYESEQEHQLEAVDHTVAVFEGLPKPPKTAGFDPHAPQLFEVKGNRFGLADEQLLENVKAVQTAAALPVSEQLRTLEVTAEQASDGTPYSFPNLSIEMETGTGKTYTYIRTALELEKRYGLSKFVIVVPSVAIRENTLKTLRDLPDHFAGSYSPYHAEVYDSEKLGRVASFATSDVAEFLVINIDAFNKDANVIRNPNEKTGGLAPIAWLQATRPVVILDEPQNMEGEVARQALGLLNPLAALRYSATHRDPYNLIHRLSPYEAYRRKLVKQIQVAGIEQELDKVTPLLRVKEILTGKTLKVKLTTVIEQADGTGKEATRQYKVGDDLRQKSNRDEYAGWVVDGIDAAREEVSFGNGRTLRVGDEVGEDKEAVFRTQISYCIRTHLRKQLELRERGVKVLSLFFIDQVQNYRTANGDDGLIAEIFDREWEAIVAEPEFAEFASRSGPEVRAAYFASKRTRGGGEELIETSEGARADADRRAFDLIMRAKEQLLGFDTPEAFIFSHSALREGWDNPNVFQICTLNQSVSTMRKRQEIGRGVRIAVDQDGERVWGPEVNVLTVVANESYRAYVEQLQRETDEDFPDDEAGKPPIPSPAKEPITVRLREDLLGDPAFAELWDRIRYRTRYKVAIDSEKLVEDCVKALGESRLPGVRKPQIRLAVAKVQVEDEDALGSAVVTEGVVGEVAAGAIEETVLDLVVNELEGGRTPLRLTRRTLLSIIEAAPNRQGAIDNPAHWAAILAATVREHALAQLVGGIKYEKLAEDDWYSVTQLKERLPRTALEVDGDPRGLTDLPTSVYEWVMYDSLNERNFVQQELREDERVRVFMKLPEWFVVDTPLGPYTPDWAIAYERRDLDGKPLETLYLVRETKAEALAELRTSERGKIECGDAHFALAEGLDFRVHVVGEDSLAPPP